MQINAIDINGNTFLHYAIKYYSNKKSILKLLLKQGADPNQKYKLGSSALIQAAEKGKYDLLKILLENGANVNQQGKKVNFLKCLRALKMMREILLYIGL